MLQRKTIGGLIAGAALVISAAAVGGANASTDALTYEQGSWSSNCQTSGLYARVDPIINYQDPGQSSHKHIFFGDDTDAVPQTGSATTYGITNSTTSLNLRAVADGSGCSGNPQVDGVTIEDKSLYWTPVLCGLDNDGNPTSGVDCNATKTVHIIAYYRTHFRDPTTIQAFPQDFAMVAGNMTAKYPGDNPHAQFSCVDTDTTVAPLLAQIPQSCPYKNGNGQLRLRVQFPSCWDQHSDHTSSQNDSDRVVYPMHNFDWPETSAYPETCPPSTVPIPELDITERINLLNQFRVDENGTPGDPSDDWFDLSDASLSSDNMDMDGDGVADTGDRGLSAHFDFLSGWTDEKLDTLIAGCFQLEINCGVAS